MLRLAIAQLKPRKGAYAENLARLGELFRELASRPAAPEVLVLPETALTGYFVEGAVRELARSAEDFYADVAGAHAASSAPPMDIMVGFYELWRTRLHNSALAASLGGPDAGIRHVHRKVFLPTYGVFDEERFVEPGRSVRAFDTRWGRAAVIICEDAWHSLVPTIAALDGAELIAVVSASPARGITPPQEDGSDGLRPASLLRWERTAQGIAGEHGVYVALAQLVGFEGGKGFPGGSLVVGPRGDVLARAPVFEEHVLDVTVDLEEIPRVRAEMPLLSDLELRLPHLIEALEGRSHERERWLAGPTDGKATGKPVGQPARAPSLSPQPARLGARPDPLAIDPELARRWLVEFLKDEVIRRRHFSKGVVAVSGGVDSAVVAFLAAEALGKDNVTALRLPYRASSPESLTDAQRVIDATGVRAETVDISAAVDGLVARLADPPDPARLGNICARMRMVTLFDRSAALGALPLGTGNKTERLFGYFTWHADDTPPVNPIGDLFKTQVLALARHLGVPKAIVEKPPTADLVAGQTDEGDFGITFAKADTILHWLLLGYDGSAIEALGYTAAEVALVRRRLDSTHWKRRLPTVAMVSQTAIGEYYLRPVDY
ncbi:MAG TPA: NAD(+) synthase [Gemmatimonadales bacterium]|jgi:NAD+ synthetase|nr:NAD(+) synthase [Gemmatimonadales bacterium]